MLWGSHRSSSFFASLAANRIRFFRCVLVSRLGGTCAVDERTLLSGPQGLSERAICFNSEQTHTQRAGARKPTRQEFRGGREAETLKTSYCVRKPGSGRGATDSFKPRFAIDCATDSVRLHGSASAPL